MRTIHYTQRIAHGLCRDCGLSELFTETRCKECNESVRAYNATVYSARKKAGICVRCGTWQAKPGRTKCEVCLLEHSTYRLAQIQGLRQEVAQLRAQLAQKGERNDSASLD